MNQLTINDKPALLVHSRAEWRQWLSQNTSDFKEIWLIYYKKNTGKPSLTKAEANKEALCFGWVDSLIQSIDDERYMQKFTQRKPGSIWSELNKKRVGELITAGLMTPAGAALVDIAKASGEWALNRANPTTEEIPEILIEELEQSSQAKLVWNQLSSSHQKQYCAWIVQAKREETRIRRARKTINMLTSGQSLHSL